MPKREECQNCKDFRQDRNLCALKWQGLEFDDVPCDKKRAKERIMDSVKSAPESRLDNKSKSAPEPYLHLREDEEERKSVVKHHNPWSRIITWTIAAALVSGAAYFGFRYWKGYEEEKKRTDLVWMARQQLSYLSTDKTVEYLRLNKMDYEDGQLKMYFDAKGSSAILLEMMDNAIYDSTLTENRKAEAEKWVQQQKDSIMQMDLLSLISIAPTNTLAADGGTSDKWKAASEYLKEAKVELTMVYDKFCDVETLTLTPEQLVDMASNDVMRQKGMDVFVEKKKEEILQYAKRHFEGDVAFSVRDVVIDKNHVVLNLVYDDKYNLGKGFYSKSPVCSHFTDPVGDMGSILDGMMSICMRTGKGFAFAYTGRTSKKVTKVAWSAKEAKALYDKMPKRFWHDEQKTNNVKTGIYREKARRKN